MSPPSPPPWHRMAMAGASVAKRPFISNGGIADFYVVFARTGEARGARGLSAFILDANTPGLKVAECIETIVPKPLSHAGVERFASKRPQG